MPPRSSKTRRGLSSDLEKILVTRGERVKAILPLLGARRGARGGSGPSRRAVIDEHSPRRIFDRKACTAASGEASDPDRALRTRTPTCIL